MNESTDRDNEARNADEAENHDGNANGGSDANGGAEPTVEIPAHEAELTRLREERDQLEQKLQRAMADTQNIRRRQTQEMADGRRRVLEGLTQELLPVLDTFGFALQAYDGQSQDGQSQDGTSADGPDAGKQGDTDALVEGVRMVRTMLSGALERHGLKEIPAEGQPFDPDKHEALGVEPNAEAKENHIVRVVQTGYVLGEHVVRHSKVIVAGPAPKAGQDDGGSN